MEEILKQLEELHNRLSKMDLNTFEIKLSYSWPENWDYPLWEGKMRVSVMRGFDDFAEVKKTFEMKDPNDVIAKIRESILWLEKISPPDNKEGDNDE